MKRRSTTSVSKGLVTKSALVAAAVVITISSPFTLGQRAFADRYDSQISALKAEISGYQQQQAVLSEQSKSLQTAIADLEAQQATLRTQIQLNQVKSEKLAKDITETQQKIVDNKAALGRIIADMYVDRSISPLEMLASSKNIGDYADKEQFRSSVQESLSKTIDTIKKLEKQLQIQKKENDRVIADQKAQEGQLQAKQAEQAKLLADTQGQEAAYQQLVSGKNAEISGLQAQQAAELAARARTYSRSSGGGFVQSADGSNGGYPYMAGPLNYTVDPWGMYARQCVSYAAFKVQQTYGNMPYWGGVGNANQWPGNARAAGIPTGSRPKVGSVGVVSSGYYGHVAWVEAINPNGTIRISHFNVNWSGNYAVWDNLDPSYFDTYIYFGG